MPLPVAEQHFGQNKTPLADILPIDFKDLKSEADAALAKIKKRKLGVKNKDDFAALGLLVNDLRKLTTKIDVVRTAETKPLFDGQKAIKAWFDQMITPINDAIAPHQKAADDWTRAETARIRKEEADAAQKLRDKADAARKVAAENDTAAGARAAGRAEELDAQADRAEIKSTQTITEAVKTKIEGGGSASASTKWEFSIANYADLDLNQLRLTLDRAAIDKAIAAVVKIQKANTELTGVKVFQDTTARFR